MICPSSNHQWLGRFSLELMRLRRGVSLPVAVTRAVVAHAHLSDLSPEHAAAIEAELLARQAARRALRAANDESVPRARQRA